MGKFETAHKFQLPVFFLAIFYFLIEAFAWLFLGRDSLWPLIFGVHWAVLLTGLIRLLPGKASRIVYCISYFLFSAYAVVQTGYYLLFKEMMWISDFRYASEGSDYFDILLHYPLFWWLGILVLAAAGIGLIRFYPQPKTGWKSRILPLLLAAAASFSLQKLPEEVFLADKQVQYAGSDYGRAQSQEAAYENMFNTHRLYQVCGIFQTATKDVYTHYLFPLTPGYRAEQEAAKDAIDSYFESQNQPQANEMTGLLKDKNVILVLMESMDDWMIGEHTPTLVQLMGESVSFVNFYTPGYGGIRTFNTEFCINTGSFLSSQGGYAFDYVTNTFDQSLANLMKNQGYSPMVFHYNSPSFYSRGVFSEAMGYDEYVCYEDYVAKNDKSLYDDNLLFDNAGLSDKFFREGKRLNFVITRSAHLSYKYNEVLSHWALKKYPEYRGLTGNEETDCALLKARLVDDFFARMLTELEARGELQNTVIIGVTDHYTYGYKDTPSLLSLSGVEDTILLEKTPCFIWSPGLEAQEVEKVLNTSDFLPTVLNLLGIKREYDYIGSDAFDSRYDGFVPFSGGSWIHGDMAKDGKKLISISGNPQAVTAEFQQAMAERVQSFIRTNNLILETDYYAEAPDT